MPSRKHQPQAGADTETTTVLKLGEFQDVPTLNLSETRLIVQAVIEKRKVERGHINETETLIKTVDYLEMFARFKDHATASNVEKILTANQELKPFERSQLGSLLPDEADEAKSLIPSLGVTVGEGRITDGQLQGILDDLQKARINAGV